MIGDDCTFEHVDGRGIGGGHRDDRIWLPDGDRMIPYNLAAHVKCNMAKGSKRISTKAALSRLSNARPS